MSNFSLPSPARLLFAALLLFAFHAPAAMADTGPWALFDGSAAISEPDADDSTNVELGVRFSVDAPASGAYWLTKVRYWRAPNRPINANRVNVYDANGKQVARGASDVAGGASGAVDVALDAPLRLTPGARYTVSYSAPTGHYPVDRGAFASSRTAGPLRFPVDAGVYRYGGGYPNSSWQSTSYYVTPIVTYDGATPPEAPVAEDSAGPWSLLTDSTDIVEPEADDASKVEVGVRFKVDAPATGAYVVKAVRVFRARSTPENWVYIYDDDRKVVARGEWLTEGGPSGVVEVKLTAPLTLRPGVEYTASYLAKWGHYADEPHGFDEGRSVGPVHFPPNAGVYQYGGGFPGDSWASSNYYVSPVVSHDATATSPAEPPSTGPVVAVRRLDDDRRPGGQRLRQGRARRPLQRRRPAAGRLRGQCRALLSRGAVRDGREPRSRLRRGRRRGGARHGDRRGRAERRGRRAARRTAPADARPHVHRELRGRQRPLRRRSRGVRGRPGQGSAAVPGGRGRLPVRRRVPDVELAVDELLRHPDRRARHDAVGA